MKWLTINRSHYSDGELTEDSKLVFLLMFFSGVSLLFSTLIFGALYVSALGWIKFVLLMFCFVSLVLLLAWTWLLISVYKGWQKHMNDMGY